MLIVRPEHILPAAIRDRAVPVRIYKSISAVINMLTVRLALHLEAVPLTPARRDIIQNAAAAADNVRRVVPLVTNITVRLVKPDTHWDQDRIKVLLIMENA